MSIANSRVTIKESKSITDMVKEEKWNIMKYKKNEILKKNEI